MRQCSDFPNGSFFMKKEGTFVQVDSQTFYLTKVVSEIYGGPADSYTVTFEGEAVQEDCRKGKPVILKFIYQMPPIFHREDYWPRLYEIDKGEFLKQCRALQNLGGSGFLPEYVAHSEGKQSADGPYPGGYLFAFVMTRLEGTLVALDGKERSVPFVLSADDMRFIKESTISAHEYFRQRGWRGRFGLCETFYNKEKKHLFFADPSLLSESTGPGYLTTPITASSSQMEMIWNSLPEDWWENGIPLEWAN